MTHSFAPLDDSLKPGSPQDEARRAYFFCREIETRCGIAVIDQLPAMPANANGSSNKSDNAKKHAHKLLTCALIYCTAIECGGALEQDWLLDFFFTALRLADEADRTPLGKQLLERVGTLTREALLTKVGSEIGDAVLAMDTAAVSNLVLQYGSESQSDRYALLQTALSLPTAFLGDLLGMMGSTEMPSG